ncbi:hypothetical protein JCM8208_007354 [Rhodotorula glutinis]
MPAARGRAPAASTSSAAAAAAPARLDQGDSDRDDDKQAKRKDVVRLGGVQGVGNEVVYVFQDALVALIGDSTRGDAAPPPADVDELESDDADSPPSTFLPILDFDLTFSPPNAEAALAAALASSPTTTTPQHPLPLAAVSLATLRDSNKAPHRLYLRHASTHAPLVELDPLDPRCFAAPSFTTWIAPAPLTKSGKPFKSRAAARRAVQPSQQAVVPTGAGGLVDALAQYAALGSRSEGIRLDATLAIELVPAGTGTGRVTLHLHLQAALDPHVFVPKPYSRPRRILLDFLLPATAPGAPGGDETAPREAGTDYFYACLERARRTVRGVPVPVRSGGEVGEAGKVESAADREAQRRRDAKGKGRARDDDDDDAPAREQQGDDDGGGPEDEQLYPPGLTVPLMPFQARSVRWMLRREGRRVVPRAVEAREGEGEGEGGGEEEGGDERMRLLGGEEEEEGLDGEAPGGSGSGLSRDRGDDDDADEERAPPILADLEPAELAALRRGPLWERVSLAFLPPRPRSADDEHDDEHDEEAPKPLELWLNRTSLALSERDPLEAMQQGGASGTATPVKKEGEGEDAVGEVGEVGEGARVSARAVGGQEGHGLLAEEVGLGKTVEVLSLVLIHTDKHRRKLGAYFNPVTDSDVQPSGLTLIIAPTAIVGQWQSEIARLAPALRVLRYEGVKALKDAQSAQRVAKRFDVVLTTFDVLRKEVVFARKPAQRGLRNKREIRYRRSLLVELDFLRVVMDEAQMVGDAVGPTSETASLISRRFSWAVTSTPLRDKIADMRPLLTFLRVEPIASGRASLQRLLEETPSFKRLWNEIGERTLKAQVQHELFLPPQKRFIVPVDLTPVERFYYDQRYADALATLGLAIDGTPQVGANVKWSPDRPEMIRALEALRQLAMHPQVGSQNRGKLALGRVVRTVAEVHAVMLDKAVADIQGAQRAMLLARVRRAQYLCWDEGVEARFETALELFGSAVDELDPVIEEVSDEVHRVWKERKKDDGRASSDSPTAEGLAGALELGFRSTEGASKDDVMNDKERTLSSRIGALRNRLRDLLFVKHLALFISGNAAFSLKRTDDEARFYAEAESLRQTVLQPYESAVDRSQALLKRQLDARDDGNGELDILDMEVSFNKEGHGLRAIQTFEDAATTSDILNGLAELIDQYRSLVIQMMFTRVSIAGDNATGEEYEDRAALQEKLDVTLEAYTVLVGEWSYGVSGVRSAAADDYKAIAERLLYNQEVLPEAGSPPARGIEGDDLPDDLDEAMAGVVGAIGGPTGRWARGSKRKAPAQDESDESDDGEGEDDEEASDGEYDAGDKKGKRRAKPAIKKRKKAPGKKTRVQAKRTANKKHNSYKDFVAPSLESGHSPADVLRYELHVERLEAKGDGNEFAEVVPLRSLIKQLREAAERSTVQNEIAILDRERNRLTQNLAKLEKVADRLRAELADLFHAFNERIVYFANLQKLSDDVADPDMAHKSWRGLLVEQEVLRQEEHEHKADIESKQSRRRYLENLNSNDNDNEDDQERTCPICADQFDRGVLTTCGHLTCQKCFKAWSSIKRSCALCKQELTPGSYSTVIYGKSASNQAQPEPDQGTAAGDKPERYVDSHGVSHDVAFEEAPPNLAELRDDTLDEITEIQTAAPLSSKSDFITKTVKHLRRIDPEAKVVIFSAWIDALDLLMESFTRNGLKFVRLEGANGKGKKEGVVKLFQEDATISTFFLHTRSQSAGLNLTVARYVFLVEPLLASHLELQAVARVHRITQTKQTVVYQFAVSDTVDRRVADLRARQGTSLFLKDSLVDAEKESRLVQQKDRAKTSVNDATEDEDDLARCILAPEAFLTLQRSLLPQRLQQHDPADPVAVRGDGDGDGDVDMAPVAGPSSALLRHPDDPDVQAAALAGMAAAGRVALEREGQGRGASDSGSGSGAREEVGPQ